MTDAPSRPLCYVAIRDEATRTKLTDALRSIGWNVVHPPTAFHLIQDLSECILGERPWQPVRLVVVEEASPGCRGSTIAQGLRDLGVDVPVAVIAPEDRPDVAPPEAPDDGVYVLPPPIAPLAITAIARTVARPDPAPTWAAA